VKKLPKRKAREKKEGKKTPNLSFPASLETVDNEVGTWEKGYATKPF